jgi:hypothetical protein
MTLLCLKNITVFMPSEWLLGICGSPFEFFVQNWVVSSYWLLQIYFRSSITPIYAIARRLLITSGLRPRFNPFVRSWPSCVKCGRLYGSTVDVRRLLSDVRLHADIFVSYSMPIILYRAVDETHPPRPTKEQPRERQLYRGLELGALLSMTKSREASDRLLSTL